MIIGIDASRATRGVRTGTERYSLQIIRHLLSLPTAIHYQWRLYTDQTLAPEQIAELTAPCLAGRLSHPKVDVCTRPARHLWTHRALAREVIQHPPDVLFVPAHVIPFVWPPARLPPSVVTIHDLGYHYFPEGHTRRQRLYLRASTQWSTRVARRVIAVSQATAHDLAALYATPSTKIRVIHEAAGQDRPLMQGSAGSANVAEADVATADMATSAVDPVTLDAVRERYSLHRPYGLYVGTIQPRKNLARLIDAYAQLNTHTPRDWDLLLVGARGWLSEPLYTQVAKLNITDRVRFLGYVPDEDLPALMGRARFFCFPSLFEGFGLPVLEAQSHGVPVMTSKNVTTTNSSLPEIAGDAALLVDPTDIDAIADAMLQLSQDENLRQRLIAAGYENVKRFSWEKAARETLAVLEEAARGERVKG